MKNLFKPLFAGTLLLGSVCVVPTTYAIDTAQGDYSDRQLSPQTQPPYPKADFGNDLLLAENVQGNTFFPQYNNTASATSWQTQFYICDPDGTGGYVKQDVTKRSGFSFAGHGQTGTYPNAGAGKHTENTKALLKKFYAPTIELASYEYVFTVTTHRINDNTGTDHVLHMGVKSCDLQ